MTSSQLQVKEDTLMTLINAQVTLRDVPFFSAGGWFNFRGPPQRIFLKQKTCEGWTVWEIDIRWWFQLCFYFHPDPWGRWSNLTNIFQMGWNHQLAYLEWFDMWFRGMMLVQNTDLLWCGRLFCCVVLVCYSIFWLLESCCRNFDRTAELIRKKTFGEAIASMKPT